MASILIIDDDITVRDYLTTLITRLGHVAIPAATCAEGLARMAESSTDVIISDIYLPDSPELDTWVDQLRKHANGRPLILITGEQSEAMAARASGGEVTALLTKPFELAFIKNLLVKVTAPAPDGGAPVPPAP